MKSFFTLIAPLLLVQAAQKEQLTATAFAFALSRSKILASLMCLIAQIVP
jgi:hypothetical protein|tara:strand:+ start:99 stop:248 length:150 start_codon:yes stop_codon:yes gene_type:complete